MDFKNKTALVTGAATGIGRAAAINFAKHGANVIAMDIDEEKLQSVKAEIAEYTKNVMIFECDVCDEERVLDVVKKSEEKFGSVDILVNNAALWRFFAPFLDTPNDVWNKFMNVNIMGVVNMIKAVLPKMLEKGYGRIINIASVAGVYGNANMALYSATKGALISMTKALAKEVSDKGILVNAVSPGSVSPADNPDMNYYQETDMSFMGRTGTDMENANLICFLASDEASYISGQNIQIDGCRRKQ